jgi:hypothetical protein
LVVVLRRNEMRLDAVLLIYWLFDGLL